MPNARAMLRSARRRLADLPELPEPWDIAEFARRVADQRGRPIELIPRVMSQYASVATGLWIRRGDRDQIVYDNSGAVLHQDHIILHELAHMLCGHQGITIHAPAPEAPCGLFGRGIDDDALARILSSADEQDRSSPVRVLHRTAYDDQQECEAETLAYVIWQTAGLRLVSGGAAITRLASAFEHH
jgi:hypothetical protein